MPSPTQRLVETPHGEARLVTRRARSPFASVVLTHGAGGGIEARDLAALLDGLPGQGASVTLLEMPWRRAGKRVAPAGPVLDACYRAALGALRVRTPLVVGGRSAGARSAARIGAAVGAAGVLALAFPLHPPGRPERSRLRELVGAGLPTLVIQGGRDPFGRPEEFPDDTELAVVPDADHGLKVPARGALSQDDALDLVVEAALEWLVREVAGAAGGNPAR